MTSAFISYSSRYKDWVATFHRHLEHCLEHAEVPGEVFLDQVDLASGSSWVSQLEAGLADAQHLLLVATPEAVASPRVSDETRAFIARRTDWSQGHCHLLWLVDGPLPPFLEPIHRLDFRVHDEQIYRDHLARLVTILAGRKPRDLVALPEIDCPRPPASTLPGELRARLVDWLAPRFQAKIFRTAAASALGLAEPNALEGHPSPECAASAALVLATGDDDPLSAALRVVDALLDQLEGDDSRAAPDLNAQREQLAAVRPPEAPSGLLAAWLGKVAADHERLVPYFEGRTELALLERVYVQLQLATEHRGRPDDAAGELLRERGPWSLRDLVALDPAEHPWVTRRWAVLGDPGAGKTTLLRHLAGTLARLASPSWVPVFESLPRLLREPEWLLDRFERQLRQAGEPAEGLLAVLDREGQEGRLLLLLDGLDEVPRERRDEAETLLRRLCARWPASAIVVTSRPIGYRRPAGDFRELELLPFDRKSRREFLARWFGRASGKPAVERAAEAATALEQDPGLRDLASNPLYLTLMALIIEQGASPASRRTALYDQVFQLLLDGGYKYPKGEPMGAQQAVRQVLRHLAETMTRDNRDAEPVTALEARLYQPAADLLREPLERVPRWRRSMRPFLEDLAEHSGILGPHDGPDADWRYWHRTFREALVAEALADKCRGEDAQAPLLAHAREIAEEDLGRWAEPYALLTGRIDDPDALVKALMEENRALGLRALATAQSLSDETLDEVLALSQKWQERAKVYGRMGELVGDPRRALALLDRLRRRTRDGNDLFFLERAVAAVAESSPEVKRPAQDLRASLYDHVPPPPEELFRWIETPLDGRVEVWRGIPAGDFLMGSPEEEEGAFEREHPQHAVEVKQPFRMAAVPVTVAQYAAFDPDHRSYHHDKVPEDQLPFHPVENVTWYEAVAFCSWLAASFPWAKGVRLPTEEEWEYACRAGTTTRYWSGEKESDLERVGWYGEGLQGHTHRVGEKPANPWGLYDVHGNVYEWTLSKWSADYSGREKGTEVDFQAIEAAESAAEASGGVRVFRGGSCWNGARDARSACRDGNGPLVASRDVGFRVVLPAAPSDPRE